MNEIYTNGFPGHDWDVLNTTLTRETIHTMEMDAGILMLYITYKCRLINTNYSLESWFFKYGGTGADMIGNEAVKEQYRTVQKKIRECGSWKLNLLYMIVGTYQERILTMMINALGGSEAPDTIYQVMKRRKMRRAANDDEAKFLEAAIMFAKEALDMDTQGMEKYYPSKVTPIVVKLLKWSSILSYLIRFGTIGSLLTSEKDVAYEALVYLVGLLALIAALLLSRFAYSHKINWICIGASAVLFVPSIIFIGMKVNSALSMTGTIVYAMATISLISAYIFNFLIGVLGLRNTKKSKSANRSANSNG